MRLLLCLALLLPAAAAPVGEGRVTGSDLAEIRAVINRQIDAFRRDDARAAFALVSPGMQDSFGTPERFLDVVRMAYRAGRLWVAYFSMQRQKDGSWRTDGYRLVRPARIISA